MKRSPYETYKSWAQEYGAKDILNKNQFEQARELLKSELKSQGKSTVNLSRTLAQKTAFTYSYKTGRTIKKTFSELGLGKITISEARNILNDKSFKQLKPEQVQKFWDRVSDRYRDLKKKGKTSAEAKQEIYETIFGSP